MQAERLNDTPVVATMIGDPCGIGPEVVVKALVEGIGPARALLIGDAGAVARAVDLTRAPLSVRAVSTIREARFDPGCIDVLDPKTLSPADVTVGCVSAACGRAVVAWWDIATRLALDKRVAAIVKAPVNMEAIKLGGAAPATADAQTKHLLLITGALRVVHLTDHIPLREVFAQVKAPHVERLIRLTHAALSSWGIAAPRIGVAGLNPHASGDEERDEIEPAIAAARGDGIDAQGPVSPDSLFRLCIEGAYDCVLAHYHDQGHIAVKTWRFQGNCAVVLGEPFLRLSVAHGTAFDIAGRGVADHRSMSAAMRTASTLAARRGFVQD